MLLTEYLNKALERKIQQELDTKYLRYANFTTDVETNTKYTSFTPIIHYIQKKVHEYFNDVTSFYHVSSVKPSIINTTGLKCTATTSKNSTHTKVFNIHYDEKRLYLISTREILCQRAQSRIIDNISVYCKKQHDELDYDFTLDVNKLDTEINYWCKAIERKRTK